MAPENEAYYLDVDYLWGDQIYQGLIDFERLGDGTALRRRLGELGITHVLISRGEVPFSFTPRARLLLDGCLSLHGRLVAERGAYALYRL